MFFLRLNSKWKGKMKEKNEHIDRICMMNMQLIIVKNNEIIILEMYSNLKSKIKQIKSQYSKHTNNKNMYNAHSTPLNQWFELITQFL